MTYDSVKLVKAVFKPFFLIGRGEIKKRFGVSIKMLRRFVSNNEAFLKYAAANCFELTRFDLQSLFLNLIMIISWNNGISWRIHKR